MSQIALSTASFLLPLNRTLSFLIALLIYFTVLMSVVVIDLAKIVVRVSGGSKLWSRLNFGYSKRRGLGFASCASSRSKKHLTFASSATSWNGSAEELAEGETSSRHFAWPDRKVRVCSTFLYDCVAELLLLFFEL